MTDLAHSRNARGVVTDFDLDAGLGSILASTGEHHAFHCIEIADGSRNIPIGIDVTFDLLAKFGRYEAANIRT